MNGIDGHGGLGHIHLLEASRGQGGDFSHKNF
jgi:hypothetical protein